MKRIAYCNPLLLFSILILFTAPLKSQIKQYVENEVIIMLHAGETPYHFERKNTIPSEDAIPLNFKKSLSDRLNIHLFTFSNHLISDEIALKQLRSQPEVLLAQFNYYVQSRETEETLPGDPSFASQWGLNNTGQTGGIVDADIDAPEAWDISTGGLSRLDDEIVIAVLDDGFDLNHNDLQFWKNLNEIPANGIDDDQNGYVDDFSGWNIETEDDQLENLSHGTEVSGIISALNNDEGIVGVSWDTPILAVGGTIGVPVSVFIEGYIYSLALRKQYNESGGKKGALIVATNSSFGIDRAFPEDSPILCTIFDSLGQEGVLNIAATANSNVNVDIVGDLPSLCPNDHLIIVTNSNDEDLRPNNAAYGPVSVDLAAPGTSILTTTTNGQYIQKTGTSFASPHAAGAIAVMMSAACPNLIAQYKNDPKNISLLFKEWLLTSVDTSAAFSETVSGGRLNLHQALLKVQEFCTTLSDCIQPTGIVMDSKTDQTLNLSWNVVDGAASYLIRYRPIGTTEWLEASSNTNSISLSGLNGCTKYEIQFSTNCSPNENSGFSSSFEFQTDGCCNPPKNIQLTQANETSILLRWSPVFAAEGYEIQYRPLVQTIAEWTSTIVFDTTATISGSDFCNRIQVRIRTLCERESSLFSSPISNPGCGACLNFNYCEMEGRSTEDEWIESISFNPGVGSIGFSHVSGNNNGYGSITDSTVILLKDETNPFVLTPGYAGFNFSEYWRIWVDINQDGDFEDDGELVFDAGSAKAGPLSDTLRLPPATMLGVSRMRISARGNSSPAELCSPYTFGEVEDYCVNIINTTSVPDPLKFGLQIYPNPGQSRVHISANKIWDVLTIYNHLGKLIHKDRTPRLSKTIEVAKFPKGIYYLQVSRGTGFITQKLIKN